MLDAAFKIDPLDPDKWWLKIKNNDKEIGKFSERLKLLDVRDPRANILFSRRIERLKKSGYEDLFLELSKHLLSQNPSNFELWIELGKLHERKNLIRLGFVMIKLKHISLNPNQENYSNLEWRIN